MLRFVLLALAAAGCASGPREHRPAGAPATVSQAVPPSLDGAGRLVHDAVNAARTREGRGALRWSDRLARVAQGHGEDMARRGYFAHVAPEGATPQDRAVAGGVACRARLSDAEVRTGVLENLYRTTRYVRVTERRLGPTRVRTPEWLTDAEVARAAVAGWLRSPGHRHNLLDHHATAEGVGVAAGPDSLVYVVQLLC